MNEQAIFLAAIDIPDAAERTRYLDEACGGNAELRGQVETLLTAHERSGEFLDRPALVQMAPGIQRGQFPDETSTEQHAGQGEIDLSFLQPSTRPGSLGRLGHYEVEQVIGRGGCGIVLKAFDERLERVVAMKVMAPELAATSPARKRFLREARAAAAVRHENVISIHAVEDQPIPFLVMEYIAGPTLQEKLDENGPLDVRDVLQIGRQIAGGLAAAHALGLIHRDIKPANILLEKGQDRIKITDFGLARTADDASVTQSGTIAGTPLYMSPEQAQGGQIDQRSDLFSLGSVLYVMCSGRPPFRAGSTLAVLKRVAEDQPRPISEIIAEAPDWLIAIIAKLHAKRPEDRFASAQEVADLLGRCLAQWEQRGRVDALGELLPLGDKVQLPRRGDAPSRPKGAAAASHSPSRSGRYRAWAAAAALVLVALAGLGMSEGAGVTDIRGTVVRLFSPDGTLVVEVDDPGVSVSIDGEELVITGAGVKEIRLKPGPHKVLASKDGKLLRQELVTVTRSGRQVVRVSKEGPAATQVTEKQGHFALRLDRRVVLPSLRLNLSGPLTLEAFVTPESERFPDGMGLIGFDFHGLFNLGDKWMFRWNMKQGFREVSYGPVVKGRRVHVAGVLDGKELRLYIDGQLRGQAALEEMKQGAMHDPFRVGEDSVSRVFEEIRFSKVARYRTDFTPAERFEPDADTVVLYHCDEGQGDVLRDASSNGHHGKIVGGAWVKLNDAAASPAEKKFTNSLGMEFALVPKGKAWLGGGNLKPGNQEVEFKEDFYLGKYEITQEEWVKVTGLNPSGFRSVKDVPDADLKRYPVEHVSWIDCQEFIKLLNAKEKEPGWEYRLPTEAEWEYACRGGPGDRLASAFDFYFEEPTNELLPQQANFNLGLNRTCTVGSYPANKLGLHDMHGNVIEWCSDELKDDKGALQYVFRGGCWKNEAWGCKARLHSVIQPTYGDSGFGLRVARVRVESNQPVAQKFRRELPTSSAALQALRRDQIPPAALAFAGNGDPKNAPATLVAVLGEPEAIHTGRVMALAFSSDGRWLASGSEDRTILLRDAATGKVLRVLSGCKSTVSCLAFISDNQTLASGDASGDLKLWPMTEDGEPMTVQLGVKDMVAAASPDGRFLAAGGVDGIVKLWKWGQWDKPVALPVVSTDKVNALAFSSDGEILACGWRGNKQESPIGLYKTTDGTLQQTLPGHRFYTHSLSFSHDGTHLSSAGENGCELWDIASAKSVEMVGSGRGGVCFSPDDKMIAAGNSGRVQVFEFASQQWRKDTDALTNWGFASKLAFSSDGKTLVVGDEGGAVCFYQSTDWLPRKDFLTPGHRSCISNLVVTAGGQSVLSRGYDGTLRLWDVTQPEENQILDRGAGYTWPVWPSLASCPDGKTFAMNDGRKLTVGDAATSERMFTVPISLSSLAYSPDGRLLAGEELNIVHIWDVKAGKSIDRFPPQKRGGGALAFSADGSLLAVTGWSDQVAVWDVTTRKEVASWETTNVRIAAFRPDGKFLATSHDDGTIQLWDTSTWTKTRTLHAHGRGGARSLKFTPDGNTLVSAGMDGVVQVCDPDHDLARTSIPVGPAGPLVTFDLDPSGKYLFASGPTPVIYVHRLPTDDVQAKAETPLPVVADPDRREVGVIPRR